MKNINTFSSNSLKVLDRSIAEFKNKYENNLSLYKKEERTQLGEKFHNLIRYYIKGFDIKKLLLNLNEKEFDNWCYLEKVLEKLKDNFIKTEYPFLIKEDLEGQPYYLTGRFDAIYFIDDIYTIYDWKTLNLPKDEENDLQTIVYLYCAAKIFNTDKIKMRYLSIEKLEFKEIHFEDEMIYKKRIDEIIKKYYTLNKERWRQ